MKTFRAFYLSYRLQENLVSTGFPPLLILPTGGVELFGPPSVLALHCYGGILYPFFLRWIVEGSSYSPRAIEHTVR